MRTRADRQISTSERKTAVMATRRTTIRRESWGPERWDALRRFYDGIAARAAEKQPA